MIEFIALHLWQMWAILAVLCLILELTAGDFFIICFSIGAVFACITDALGGGIILQLVVFAVFTLASLFFVRPFAVRFLHKGESNRVSNADALLGRKGRVVETIKADSFGRVQIDGDVWKAVTNEPQDIPEGTNVRVVSRESTIITVVRDNSQRTTDNGLSEK
ncbi:MAG: NfeD family protein [Bacteroidaceae bacterium]|jgi:membrane protein implicated in regulation of membrane protease activity|nr:NfeD family protein [Bacteroidaceae bacterium]